MTTTIDTTETIQQVTADRLVPHPDNVRGSLGDLRELTRSITAQGIIVPLLVLPANDDGAHVIVAGHRRFAAGVAANVERFPVLVRDLTPVQVLDAMLVENGHRSDLTLMESIRAVARYQFLDPKDAPTRIARRIGRSAGWVKSRLALALLPAEVLAMLDSAALTMVQAEALGAVVDDGDDAVVACAQHLAESRHVWREPSETVASWRADRASDARHAEIVAKLDRLGVTRFDTDIAARDARAISLDAAGLGLDKGAARAHRHEPCHAVVVHRRRGEIAVVGYCTDPKRHRATSTHPALSEIVTAAPARAVSAVSETERAFREARKARHAAAGPMVAKGRWPKGEGLVLAARVWCDTIGEAAARKASEFLAVARPDGPDTTGYRQALVGWLDDGGDPARLLVALAGAELETWGRQAEPLPGGGKADASAAWLDLLVHHGGYVSGGHDLT